jgi:hypothetical protein
MARTNVLGLAVVNVNTLLGNLLFIRLITL